MPRSRTQLPLGVARCPNCDQYNERDDLEFHPKQGWVCPACGYPDPYWND